MNRRVTFWSKLAIVSSCWHLVFLFLIFFMYSGQKSTFNININRSILHSGAPIVFMPLKRTVPKSMHTHVTHKVKVTKAKAKKIVSKKKSPTKKTTVAKKKKVTQKKKTLAKKTTVTKKKKASAYAKASADKPPKKKTLAKKKFVPKPKKKPAAKKKVMLKKKPASNKKIVKQQKVKPVPKKENKKAVTKNSENKKIKKVAHKEIENKKIEKITHQTNQELANGQEAIYIGQQEIEALKVDYEIKREVEKHWRPPVGLSKDLSCTVSVLVDWSGNIKESKVTKSSGVLIYDISVRTAVSKISLPKAVKGKELDITFEQ